MHFNKKHFAQPDLCTSGEKKVGSILATAVLYLPMFTGSWSECHPNSLPDKTLCCVKSIKTEGGVSVPGICLVIYIWEPARTLCPNETAVLEVDVITRNFGVKQITKLVENFFFPFSLTDVRPRPLLSCWTHLLMNAVGCFFFLSLCVVQHRFWSEFTCCEVTRLRLKSAEWDAARGPSSRQRHVLHVLLLNHQVKHR